MTGVGSKSSEAYLSGLPLELGHQADLLLRQQSLKPLKRLLQRDHNLPLAGELVDRIKDMVEPFALTTPTSGSGWKRQVALSETELKRQAEIIDDLLHHGNIATTLGLLNEWTVSWVVWRRGREREWLDYQNVRRGAGNFLDAITAVGRDPDLRNVLTDEQRTLGVFWSSLRELRNAYAHHGMRPQDIVGNQKAKQLSLLQNRRSAGFLPEAAGRARSAGGTLRSRRCGATDAAVQGTSRPVMRASTCEEMSRISVTIRSSSRLFSIHSW